jgi:MFS family permease
MVSYGFTLLYTAFSMVAGRVADTTHKGKTLAAACLTWSSALLLQGLVCTGYYSALACRVVQGIAMAYTGPQVSTTPAEM